jgi:iduronate 2-sulfatase
MNRPRSTPKIATGLALICGAVSGFAASPNILFIVVDDLKPAMGCYGDEHVLTPNMDRLANSGLVLLNAHCQQAVCGPSRASLLTGLLPDRNGVRDLRTRMRDVHPDVVTLPEYFKHNGYYTQGMGKVFDGRNCDGPDTQDVPSWSVPYSMVTGLRSVGYYAGEAAHQAVSDAKRNGTWDSSIGEIPALEKIGYLPATECADVPDDAYGDGEIAKLAARTLGELANNKTPFFLAVGFTRPHLPFAAPKKYWDLYDREKIELAPFRDHAEGAPEFSYHPSGELREYTDIPPRSDPRPLPDAKQRELIHGYYAATSYVDAQIGVVMDKLDALGLAEDTIVVLWGDHGWHLGDHGLWCKHTVLEQATRAPLIFRWPQRLREKRFSATPVEFVDVFPTLADMAGLGIPAVLDGRSLTPLFTDAGAATFASLPARSQFQRKLANGDPCMGYSIRTERYRWTEWRQTDYAANNYTGPTVATELYDYEADPLETKNLAGTPKLAGVERELRARFRERYPYLSADTAPDR